MKIKSLLLGSAAAMVAVTGAKAADAIVVEPEPVEYVRVCDMYGAGYFYIPGDANETCIRFGGYVQAEYWVNHDHDEDEISDHNGRVRTRFQVEAKNETQYGTLSSRIWFINQKVDEDDPHDDFSTSEGFGATDTQWWRATFSLAGFRVGYDATDGTIWNTYGGYGFYTAVNSGSYGFQTGMFVEYNGSFGDNFNYGIGVVDAAASGAPGQPDLMAGMSTSMGTLSVGAAVVYDSSESAWAYRVRGDLDLSSFMPGGSLGGWWRADHGDTDYVKGHQWGVTAKMNLVDNVQLFAGYSDYQSETNADVARWTAGLKWDIAPGLWVIVEHAKTLTEKGTTTSANNFAINPTTGALENTGGVTSQTGGASGVTWIRMRRSF
ncbi:porin [Salaquimonas pukyongi]|uniref:porin n=1 Tax=Salaquimonas pukyongi TaxID=2712698 RepID=UPI00096B9B9A|nr:porin [Salaquimonas pukyongi]